MIQIGLVAVYLRFFDAEVGCQQDAELLYRCQLRVRVPQTVELLRLELLTLLIQPLETVAVFRLQRRSLLLEHAREQCVLGAEWFVLQDEFARYLERFQIAGAADSLKLLADQRL